MCEHGRRRQRGRSYLREGRYPLRQLGLDLRQRLGLPHRLLQLLLGELQPLLQLPVLLLHLQAPTSPTRKTIEKLLRGAVYCKCFN